MLKYFDLRFHFCEPFYTVTFLWIVEEVSHGNPHSHSSCQPRKTLVLEQKMRTSVIDLKPASSEMELQLHVRRDAEAILVCETEDGANQKVMDQQPDILP